MPKIRKPLEPFWQMTDNAVVRIEGELMARPALAGLTGRAPKKLRIGRELT